MSGDTMDKVRVVSGRVVKTQEVLTKIVLGLHCMREWSLVPIAVSVGGFLASTWWELKSPTVMQFGLGGLSLRF